MIRWIPRPVLCPVALYLLVSLVGCGSYDYAVIKESGRHTSKEYSPLVEEAEIVERPVPTQPRSELIGSFRIVPAQNREGNVHKLREGTHKRLVPRLKSAARREAAKRGATMITVSDVSRLVTEEGNYSWWTWPRINKNATYTKRYFFTELAVTLYRSKEPPGASEP